MALPLRIHWPSILGRIVVAGWRTNISGNINMTIWRYNSDGTPDLNFGSGTGFTESNNASVQDIGYAGSHPGDRP